MRNRVVLNLAASVDGFIARPNGDVAWLFPFSADYGMRAFWKSCGAAVMGAKTFRDVLKFDGGPYPAMANFVVTHKKLRRDGFTFVSGNLNSLVRTMSKAADGKDVWLVGGAVLNAAFLDAGLIDRFVITTVPVVLGDGIPIIAGGRKLRKVGLVARRAWKDGVVQTTYARR